MPSRLPPLNACRAFEAAARLGSFVRAASELNVTAAAVSYQVTALEKWTGKRLFNRFHNGVVPTNAARLLAPVITDALERMSDGLLNLTGDTGPALVRFSVQPDFALKWLNPGSLGFRRRPRTELNLVTSYRSLDLLSDTLDLAVRYLVPAEFTESATQLRADHLLTADLVPVVSPALFPPERPADPTLLRHATLPHVLTVLDDWRRWLSPAPPQAPLPAQHNAQVPGPPGQPTQQVAQLP